MNGKIETPYFVVYADYEDSRYVIGILSDYPNPTDLDAYFEDMKGYQILIEPLLAIRIPPGFACEWNKLKAEKSELEKRIKQVDKHLTDHRVAVCHKQRIDSRAVISQPKEKQDASDAQGT